jgi:hypothetical protein
MKTVARQKFGGTKRRRLTHKIPQVLLGCSTPPMQVPSLRSILWRKFSKKFCAGVCFVQSKKKQGKTRPEPFLSMTT